MSGVVEESKAGYEAAAPPAANAGNLSIAVIGPNEMHRKTMARALSSSTRRSVREFTDYPAKLNDVPRLLEEHFDVVMVDVDSDESYGLKIIETIAGTGGTVVMAYSRRSDRDLMAMCMRAGARDFLPLPTDAAIETAPAPVAEPAPQPQEEETYRFSGELEEEPFDELDAVDDVSTFTYDYAAEEQAAKSVVPPAPAKEPTPTEAVKPANDFDEWDSAHLRFMKSSTGPQAVSRHAAPSEPLPGSVEEWDQAHLKAAESIAAKGSPLTTPRSPTVADLFAKAERAEKHAEVASRLEAPYKPEPAPKKKKKEAPSLSVVPSIVPRRESEAEPERPPIPPEMRARSSKKFKEAPAPVVPEPMASAAVPLAPPPISHEQFLRSDAQRVDEGDGDMFSRQPDRRRVVIPDEPLFQYSAPEEEKKKSGLVPWIIFSMGLGVVVCLVIVFYAHPYGIGLPVVASGPAPVQATTPAEPSEKTAGTILDDSAVPPKPAASSRNSDATEADGNATSSNPVSSSMMDAQLSAQAKLSQDIKKPKPADDGDPAAGFTPTALDNGATTPGAVFGGSNSVKVVPASTAISAGVASGLLIHKTAPIYPKFAKDARISGTVVLGATIQASGALTGLHVISGPDALRGSALDAARNWRYRPYLLDNKPVEVQTTINVVFNLGQ